MVVGLVSYAALGSLVGVAVGAVEILQRYRDAPFRAIDTPPADASGQSDTLHLLGLAAGAGFGGAALIRARLATIRLPSKRCCPSLPHGARADGRHRLRARQEAAAEGAVPGDAECAGGGSRASLQFLP